MSQLSIAEISSLIKDVPDFPKPGILFKDITPVLESGLAFRSLVEHFVQTLAPETTKLAAIESRGFILASAIAQHRNLGVVLVRKPGKLPRESISHSYDLEYGQDCLEIHKDSFSPEDRVTIIDDVLATGGTAQAAEQLCQKAGAHILGSLFFMEISFLRGHQKLSHPYKAFLQV